MSTATTVPETRGQTAGDAGAQVRETGVGPLLVEASRRFRAADGTSYSRAIGLSSVLSLIPAMVAAVGLVTTFDLEGIRRVLDDTMRSLAPGPAGTILTDALGSKQPGTTALLAGLAGMLVAGTLGMVQLERGANRIYGVDEHRSGARRFLIALALAATAGVLLILGLAVIAAGEAIGRSATTSGAWTGSASTAWSLLRWPVGVVLVAAPMTLIFKVGPNRRQPHFSWLMSGTVVAVALWLLVSVLLAIFYENAGTLGETYGPLLGVIALLVWAHLTGVAVLFGLAVAAQLEAVRAGEHDPEREVADRPEARDAAV